MSKINLFFLTIILTLPYVSCANGDTSNTTSWNQKFNVLLTVFRETMKSFQQDISPGMDDMAPALMDEDYGEIDFEAFRLRILALFSSRYRIKYQIRQSCLGQVRSNSIPLCPSVTKICMGMERQN